MFDYSCKFIAPFNHCHGIIDNLPESLVFIFRVILLIWYWEINYFPLILFSLCYYKGHVHLRLGQADGAGAGRSGSAAQGSGSAAQRSGSAAQRSGRVSGAVAASKQSAPSSNVKRVRPWRGPAGLTGAIPSMLMVTCWLLRWELERPSWECMMMMRMMSGCLVKELSMGLVIIYLWNIVPLVINCSLLIYLDSNVISLQSSTSANRLPQDSLFYWYRLYVFYLLLIYLLYWLEF